MGIHLFAKLTATLHSATNYQKARAANAVAKHYVKSVESDQKKSGEVVTPDKIKKSMHAKVRQFFEKFELVRNRQNQAGSASQDADKYRNVKK